jgi:hypothetical protein
VIGGGRGSYLLLTGCLLACAGAGDAGGHARKTDLRTLETSQARTEVAAAAIRVAAGGDTAALDRLGKLLTEPAFLARLDDTANPQLAFSNLDRVFSALAKKPSAATESLCLRVMAAETFTAKTERIFFVLPALAAVRPMSAAGAGLIAKTNAEGYYALNGPLLAANGSPRAMALLEAMLADRSGRVVDRIDMSREALVPHRTALATVRLVGALTRRPDLEPELATALAECLYDYHPEWYGKRRSFPIAPPWKEASAEARSEAADLGRKLLARKDLPERLRAAIESAIKAAPAVRTSPTP